MIRSINIKQFRGIKNLQLDGLQPITLISGKNNVGKSTILEAIFYVHDHTSPDVFYKLANFRGDMLAPGTTQLWEPLFNYSNRESNVEIEIQYENGSARMTCQRDYSYANNSLDLQKDNKYISQNPFFKSAERLKAHFESGEYIEDSMFSLSAEGVNRNSLTNMENNELLEFPHTVFLSNCSMRMDVSIVERIGSIELENKKHLLIDALKLIDPTINDISVISQGGLIKLFVQSDDKMIPIKYAGDGIYKLLNIVISIVENQNSIILIDEIETGFHYEMYPMVWDVIARMAQQYHCQIIATTHSYECISGMLKDFNDKNYKSHVAYYRIYNENGYRCARYDFEQLSEAFAESWEVR